MGCLLTMLTFFLVLTQTVTYDVWDKCFLIFMSQRVQKYHYDLLNCPTNLILESCYVFIKISWFTLINCSWKLKKWPPSKIISSLKHLDHITTKVMHGKYQCKVFPWSETNFLKLRMLMVLCSINGNLFVWIF